MKNALISTYNKANLLCLGKFLLDKGITIYSTGGTYRQLVSLKNSKIKQVSSLTGFPEILKGRVKTLHPKIFGGILGKREYDIHAKDLSQHDIPFFDIVVVNLYPFSETLTKTTDEDEILENIDIGGHSLIRAASKNYKDVLTVINPNDYEDIIDNFDKIDVHFKKKYAMKAMQHITQYDMAISQWFNKDVCYKEYHKMHDLKYGLNPQQASWLYSENKTLPFQILNGNPGHINILDAIYGWNLVSELSSILDCPAIASYKHTSPAGVATFKPLSDKLKKAFMVDDIELSDLATTFVRARNVDPMSSFGDFIAVSHTVDVCTANMIKKEISDGIIAPNFTKKALEILKRKKRGAYIIFKGTSIKYLNKEFRSFHGLTLVQEPNNSLTTMDDLTNVVTVKKELSDDDKRNMIIGNTLLKYTQSNSVTAVFDGQAIGVGAGQQSRIDCVRLVKRKAETWFLRQHDKVFDLMDKFKTEAKRTQRVNAIIRYIQGEFTTQEYMDWIKLIKEDIPPLTRNDKEIFLKKLDPDNVCLASDAFLPFRDNIDVASQFGVKFIVQPGGSIRDDDIIKACNEYGMTMVMTGKNMRMFLH